jgi:hypothetical protein
MPQRDEAEHVLGSLLHRWAARLCPKFGGEASGARYFYCLAALAPSKELSSSVITARIPS